MADLCEVWSERLRKEVAETGPVTLCYTDGPMFVEPYGPRRKLAMLQQEAYPTNAAALARVKMIWGRPDVHGAFIMERAGNSLWNRVELIRVVDGTDKGAPTVRNTITKIANYVRENLTSFARGPKQLSAADEKMRIRNIQALGDELERLADSSENTVVKYADFELLLERLHNFGFFPTNRQVSDVAHAIRGHQIARAAD
jgi:hypothetical protein